MTARPLCRGSRVRVTVPVGTRYQRMKCPGCGRELSLQVFRLKKGGVRAYVPAHQFLGIEDQSVAP